ncbi:MAG TPA: GNAT family N-acetyltransferase [Pyrinomonadaceae bacterium]|nr:GNAT family N-acetyltransferase [Pyrinomonadaceae bacterium]
MRLQDISPGDLPLYESIHCDPQMMEGLGGALSRERVAQMLRHALESVKTGTAWVFKIISDDERASAAGTVCIWENSWQGESINEIGWMILPEFQGRGMGTKAVSAILERARSEGRWDVIHAFPSTANARSNSICRKMGFSMIEECDLEWSGRSLRCNHWRLDFSAGAGERPDEK